MQINRDDEFLWEQKYRPKTLDECILPKQTLGELQEYIKRGEIGHLLFTGKSGVGKTTVAFVLCEILDCDVLFINASKDNGIDVLRTRVTSFAASMSMSGKTKVVILDEADHLSQAVQPALRGFMEEFSKNCRFIFTCNYPDRIIEPLRKRCARFDFTIPKEEKKALQVKSFERCKQILALEGIPYEDNAVASVIRQEFPDFRTILIQLQRYSLNGKIDDGILRVSTEDSFNQLITILKTKNFQNMRKWVSDNVDIAAGTIYSEIYNKCGTFVTQQSIPQLILTLADYQHKAAFVANQEINLAACLTEIMASVQFSE